MRFTFTALLLAPLAALHAVAAFAADNPPSKPNIVLILADDLGYGDLGCYGATKVKTPNLDRLAREGMRFTDAHSPSSVCTPSRYNLLTGRYCWRTWARTGAVWANDPLLVEEGRLTLSSLLKSAGYFTGIVGKWHLGFGKPGTPGWDDVLGPDYNRELKPGPLECGFDYSFVIPHVGQFPHFFIEGHRVVGLDPKDPIQIIADPRPEFAKNYLERPRTKNPDLRVKGGAAATYQHEDLALKLTEKAVAFVERHHDRPFFLYLAHRNVHGPIKPNARFKGTSEIGAYGDYIHELDWSVGEVLAALDRLKLTDKTLVLFSSDNGGVKNYKPDEPVVINGHRINGPLRGMKTEVYEGGQRVPFLARWPGRIQAGTTSGQLLAQTDLLATFAALTGQPLPHNAGEDSFNLLPALLGEDGGRPLRPALVMDSLMQQFAVREGPWKLIQCQGGGGLGWDATPRPDEPPGQLYNLADDLGETRNLYATHPDIVRRLTALLKKCRTESRTRP